jgi:hypothetical protein
VQLLEVLLGLGLQLGERASGNALVGARVSFVLDDALSEYYVAADLELGFELGKQGLVVRSLFVLLDQVGSQLVQLLQHLRGR